jgi:hypothetical protein
MTARTRFREKYILARAIVVRVETQHTIMVSLNYSRKRSLIYTHPEDKYYNTLYENTHWEET